MSYVSTGGGCAKLWQKKQGSCDTSLDNTDNFSVYMSWILIFIKNMLIYLSHIMYCSLYLLSLQGGKKLERSRDLFEQCLDGCPKKFAKGRSTVVKYDKNREAQLCSIVVGLIWVFPSRISQQKYFIFKRVTLKICSYIFKSWPWRYALYFIQK